jgi:hypothetical protein
VRRGSPVRRWSSTVALTQGPGRWNSPCTDRPQHTRRHYVTGTRNWRQPGQGGVAHGSPRATERGSAPGNRSGRGWTADNSRACTEMPARRTWDGKREKWRPQTLRWARLIAAAKEEPAVPSRVRRTRLTAPTRSSHTPELGTRAVVLLCPARLRHRSPAGRPPHAGTMQ